MRFLLPLVVISLLTGCMIRPNNHSSIAFICYREDAIYGVHPSTGLSIDCNKKRIVEYRTKMFVPDNYHSASIDRFQEWRKNRDK